MTSDEAEDLAIELAFRDVRGTVFGARRDDVQADASEDEAFGRAASLDALEGRAA